MTLNTPDLFILELHIKVQVQTVNLSTIQAVDSSLSRGLPALLVQPNFTILLHRQHLNWGILAILKLSLNMDQLRYKAPCIQIQWL